MAFGTVTTIPAIPYKTYPASAAIPLNFTASTASGVLSNSKGTAFIGYVLGWVISETTGSGAASFTLWDNLTAPSGLNYGLVSLASGGCSTVWFGTNAIRSVSGGLYLQVNSGSVSGAVFYTT